MMHAPGCSGPTARPAPRSSGGASSRTPIGFCRSRPAWPSCCLSAISIAATRSNCSPVLGLAADRAADGGLPRPVDALPAAAMAIATRRGAKLAGAAAGRHESEHGPDDERTAAVARPARRTRAQQVDQRRCNETDFLARLRKTHDVAVYQFGEDLKHDRVVYARPSCGPRGPPLPMQELPADEPTARCPQRPAETPHRLGQAARAHRHGNPARPGACGS